MDLLSEGCGCLRVSAIAPPSEAMYYKGSAERIFCMLMSTRSALLSSAPIRRLARPSIDGTARLTIAAQLATCRSADRYAGAYRLLFGELDVFCGWGPQRDARAVRAGGLCKRRDVVRVAVRVLANWQSAEEVHAPGRTCRQFRTRDTAGASPARNAARAARVDALVKKIGFLSFGHWSSSPGSHTRSASDALLQSIDLAVAAEELGADGAYFRVHHFARQLGSPFPLLAAVGARTSRIEIGTAVIDMRYENPLYMAEDAGAADLISGGRLQLGISRGSPEQVIEGWRYFGYQPQEGQTDADMARGHAQVLLEVLGGEGFAQPNPRPMFPNPPGLLRVEPHSRRAAGAHLVGRRVTADRHVGGRAGHEPAEFDADHQRVGQALSPAAG